MELSVRHKDHGEDRYVWPSSWASDTFQAGDMKSTNGYNLGVIPGFNFGYMAVNHNKKRGKLKIMWIWSY